MKPNIQNYNPDPTYLRYLIEKSGHTQNLASKLIGVNTDNFRKMLTGKIKAPYSVQYVLEGLVDDENIVKKMQKNYKDYKNQGLKTVINMK